MTNSRSLSLLLTGFLAFAACGKKSTTDSPKATEKVDLSHEGVSLTLSPELRTIVDNNDLVQLAEFLKKNPTTDLNRVFSDDGETLLTTAIKKDYRDMRSFILAQGASGERTNTNKETPLIAAVLSGTINSVEVLIDRDVDLNKVDITGRSALYHAIENSDNMELPKMQRKNSEIIALILVKAGASVELTVAPDSKNAYQLALDHKSQPVQDLIRSIMEIEYGTPDIGTFTTVLKTGNTNSLEFMLTRYPSMPMTYDSINPFMIALEYRSEIVALKMMQILIRYKTDVNGARGADETPLIRAAKMNNKGFAWLFMEAGADIQREDAEGKSAIVYAVANKSAELVDLLVNAGAKKKYRAEKTRFYFDGCKQIKEFDTLSADEATKTAVKSMRTSLGCSGFGLMWPF